ncbi:MAG: S49 family peptidase, partial [Roseinatronobacter sp.]
LSGQLDQDGVRVTLIHSGQHKIDGNPYQPLPEAVRGDIQREIDVLRFLFAETVAAGRRGKITQEAALATEAATYRGTDTVAAGLADEVTDLMLGFAAFRNFVAQRPPAAIPRADISANRPSALHTQPKQEATMAKEIEHEDKPEQTHHEPYEAEPHAADALNDASADAGAPHAEAPPPSVAAPTPLATQPCNLAELSAQLREAAAEIAEIAAQAGRLGIAIDAAKALREGTAPEALRRQVLERASAAADARDIIAAAPPAALPAVKESPLVAAAAKRAASARARH